MKPRQTRLGLATESERSALAELVRLPTLRDHGDAYMREVIAACGRDLTLAAAVLGVGRATLYRWAKRLGAARDASGDDRRRQRVERLFADSRGKW